LVLQGELVVGLERAKRVQLQVSTALQPIYLCLSTLAMTACNNCMMMFQGKTTVDSVECKNTTRIMHVCDRAFCACTESKHDAVLSLCCSRSVPCTAA
jgi:hypothetical protein